MKQFPREPDGTFKEMIGVATLLVEDDIERLIVAPTEQALCDIMDMTRRVYDPAKFRPVRVTAPKRPTA